jgi:hypothetical protein
LQDIEWRILDVMKISEKNWEYQINNKIKSTASKEIINNSCQPSLEAAVKQSAEDTKSCPIK